MSKLHLLCELNDENYTLASFSFVRHSIEYCRIEAEDDAFILNTRISIMVLL